MKIAVLAGGLSPEREVSLTSGTLIANALVENGHAVALIDVYMGIPTLPDDPKTLFSHTKYAPHAITEAIPDLASLAATRGGDALIGENVLKLCALADRVFLALHGGIGENGQLQATLDTHGIRYTGSGYAGSLLAMDKDLSKRLLRESAIPTPDWVTVDASSPLSSLERIKQEVGFPCVVKPASCGSSVGISMPENEEELCAALLQAADWDTRILVEKKIVGRELTVGILCGQVLPAVEIIPEEGFYDYKNKYQGTTREICPAELPTDVAVCAAELTARAFDTLRLSGYARFDYILDEAGALWCLEANTLPGMTPTSLLPLAAKTVGIDYNALCERIIEA